MSKPLVGIIMGSQSDLKIMREAAEFMEEMGIAFELTIVSAHRTPARMVEYASTARDRGLKVIIAGAGGAAHLPGMVASMTSLPVIGVPVKSSNSIDGCSPIRKCSGTFRIAVALESSRPLAANRAWNHACDQGIWRPNCKYRCGYLGRGLRASGSKQRSGRARLLLSGCPNHWHDEMRI